MLAPAHLTSALAPLQSWVGWTVCVCIGSLRRNFLLRVYSQTYTTCHTLDPRDPWWVVD